MKYLTSIENSIYYHWQMELMIESFKQKNIQNKLYITLPNNKPDFYIPKFYKNLSLHDNIIYYQNFNEDKKINSLYSFWNLLQKELIENSFCYVTSDCVIQNPLNLDLGTKPEIHISLDPWFTLDLAERHLDDLWSLFSVDGSKDFKNYWISLGQVIAFHQVPLKFFEELIKIAQVLVSYQIANKNKVWELTERVALVLAIIFHSQNITIKNTINVQHVTSNQEANFITYEHGMNDIFNKKQFTFLNESFLAAGDPFEILSNCYQTKNINYIGNLVRSTNK